MFENAYVAATIVVAAICSIFGTLIYLASRPRRDRYPFDSPDFVHVGFNTEQHKAVFFGDDHLRLSLEFVNRIPRHHSGAVDATYYAMTPDEFLRFYNVLAKHVRGIMAEAAEKAREQGKPYLTGVEFTLSHLIIELTPLRDRFGPPLPSPFPAPIDMTPARPDT